MITKYNSKNVKIGDKFILPDEDKLRDSSLQGICLSGKEIEIIKLDSANNDRCFFRSPTDGVLWIYYSTLEFATKKNNEIDKIFKRKLNSESATV